MQVYSFFSHHFAYFRSQVGQYEPDSDERTFVEGFYFVEAELGLHFVLGLEAVVEQDDFNPDSRCSDPLVFVLLQSSDHFVDRLRCFPRQGVLGNLCEVFCQYLFAFEGAE